MIYAINKIDESYLEDVISHVEDMDFYELNAQSTMTQPVNWFECLDGTTWEDFKDIPDTLPHVFSSI